ncbi:MAG TPA: AI-2E family transporter [candidate division Zixibacteria bacterium]|jgi:predicted PurR-regulated permease PerM|nr:AI-2E family transporter [candidate division Zixibacteria bacterium]
MFNQKYLTIPVLAVGLLYLLHLGRSFLVPLVFAFFIWYLVNALAGLLGRVPLGKEKRFPKALAYAGALAAIAVLIFVVVRIITVSVTEVAASAPAVQQGLDRLAQRVFDALPVSEPPTLQKLLGTIDLGKTARLLAMQLTEFLGKFLIVLLYLAFIFLEQRSFESKLLALAKGPERQRAVRSMISQIDADIKVYLGIKTLTSLATGLAGYLIFTAVGLELAGFWALLLFVLNFIPTIGSIAATALPAMMSLVQFEGLGPFLAIVIGLTLVQQALGNFIEPRFLGDRLNLSPLVILLSLALWGMVWGISGMMLCVPMTAIAMIILSHIPQTRPVAVILSRNGRIRTSA